MIQDKFPRTSELPAQSPLFWVSQKDRYLRQLLIYDIENETKRKLLVYYTNCQSDAMITGTDDIAFAELLTMSQGEPIDLLIETNGGETDATEKLCTMLNQIPSDVRVIVPRRAKSNGTVIALCGNKILMGPQSELGPIDPFISNIPSAFIIDAANNPSGTAPIDPILLSYAKAAINQTKKLARYLLKNNMLKNKSDEYIENIVEKLATKKEYYSHGSAIDCKEARQLGLSVEMFNFSDDLWQKIWLLRTMYQYDCDVQKYEKIFESSNLSTVQKITN